jgi:hypothetical protein
VLSKLQFELFDEQTNVPPAVPRVLPIKAENA